MKARDIAGSVLLWCVVMTGGSPGAWAGGGSLYSRLGLGDLHPGANVRGAGMGYTGLAFASPTTINGFAPATWSKIDRARIEVGVRHEGFQSTDGVNERYLARTDFDGALLAIPVSAAKGIVTAFGFVPYSTVDYVAFSNGELRSPGDTLRYRTTYTGTGGISKGFIGLSYSPLAGLTLGSSLNYLFGTIDHTTSVVDRVGDASPGISTEALTMNGLTVTLGALVDGFGGISEALTPLSLGVQVTTAGTLTTTHKFLYDFADQSDTSAESSGSVSIPLAFDAGLAYRVTDRILVAADLHRQAWSGTLQNGASMRNVRDATAIGVGAEFLPVRTTTADAFLDRLAFRIGVFYQSTYFQLQDQPIEAWGATAGVGVPLTGDTRLHVALEYGVRGTTDHRLIRDSIFRLSAALTLSELWFSRYEDE